MLSTFKSNWKFFFLASITLGLAPFSPPHIWVKLKWITDGGAIYGDSPMQVLDWFDLVMHGAPWLLLILSSTLIIIDFIKTKV
ncbi:MAG: hypothetical protein AB8B74_01680 [Crocinitomicaceae bacterium]